MEATTVETHPVQTRRPIHRGARISTKVTLAAYEVYCALFGPQEALIDDAGRGCRGGFGAGELMAFLYARAFPRSEWRQRFDEALQGMEQL
jgi:hypothetical protein